MGTPGEKIVMLGAPFALVLGVILAIVHERFGVTWGWTLVGVGVPCAVGVGVLCLVVWLAPEGPEESASAAQDRRRVDRGAGHPGDRAKAEFDEALADLRRRWSGGP